MERYNNGNDLPSSGWICTKKGDWQAMCNVPVRLIIITSARIYKRSRTLCGEKRRRPVIVKLPCCVPVGIGSTIYAKCRADELPRTRC